MFSSELCLNQLQTEYLSVPKKLDVVGRIMKIFYLCGNTDFYAYRQSDYCVEPIRH